MGEGSTFQGGWMGFGTWGTGGWIGAGAGSMQFRISRRAVGCKTGRGSYRGVG
jgi:hypothetical protein